MAVYVTIYGHVCVIHTPKLCYICIHMYVCICIRMYVCMYVCTHTHASCVCLSLSLSLSLALYQQNQVDVVRICGPIYGISGVYSPYLWPYINLLTHVCTIIDHLLCTIIDHIRPYINLLTHVWRAQHAPWNSFGLLGLPAVLVPNRFDLTPPARAGAG